MTPGVRLRKAVIVLPLLALAGCGGMEPEQGRFESLARMVAAVEVPARPGETAARSSGDVGLRPAVRVEVMEPHELWDARDAGLRGAIETAAPALVEAAAPAVQAAAVGAVQQAVDQTLGRAGPAREPAAAAAPARAAASLATIQLGAFSSAAAAEAAWAEVARGPAASLTAGLQPMYSTVQVNDRTFTRLRVRLSGDQAARLCRLAEVSDPWCRTAA
jgi:hypothetical protein